MSDLSALARRVLALAAEKNLSVVTAESNGALSPAPHPGTRFPAPAFLIHETLGGDMSDHRDRRDRRSLRNRHPSRRRDDHLDPLSGMPRAARHAGA